MGYKKQIGIKVHQSSLVMDYVLQVDPSLPNLPTRHRVILEVQGGGETGSTGSITDHVKRWMNQQNPSNTYLGQHLSQSFLLGETGKKTNVPSAVPNNAWKRQLDQIIKKSMVAAHFNGAFAIVLGDYLYEYFIKNFPNARPYFPDWDIAFVAMGENQSKQPGPIGIDRVSRAVFMTQAEFVAALHDVKVSAGVNNPFSGEFRTLRNNIFRV